MDVRVTGSNLFLDSHYFIRMISWDESFKDIIWRVVSSNLVPLLKPNCSKKNNSSREQESSLCFHWGTLVPFLGESSQIFVQFGPTSLAKLPHEKRKGGWSKFSEQKENWSPMFSLGNLQISWGKWAQSSLTNMVCPKELQPICSRKTCFLGGTWAHLPWETVFP